MKNNFCRKVVVGAFALGGFGFCALISGEFAPAHASPGGAESDAMRNQYALEFPVYKILGAGHPNFEKMDPVNSNGIPLGRNGKNIIDKPDGLAFTADGKLLVIETKNKRVGIYAAGSFELLGFLGDGGGTSAAVSAPATRLFSATGEIVGVSVSPLSGEVFVADEDANEVHVFGPDFQYRRKILSAEGFRKLGGITVDANGRLYAVDATLREVRRYFPNGKKDETFQLTTTRDDGSPILDLCEGVVADTKRGFLYVSSELDSAIQVFDLETGIYLGRTIGANLAAPSTGASEEEREIEPSPTAYPRPSGKTVFFKSVEGLTLVNGRYLLGVDEDPGHIQIFDLNSDKVWNRDLVAFDQDLQTHRKREGYLGYFGKSAPYDFDGDKALKAKVKKGEIIPGDVNAPGYFCSPDGIASYTGGGWTYIAVADQCNFRIAMYRFPSGNLWNP